MRKKKAKFFLVLFAMLFVIFAVPKETEAASSKTMKKAYVSYMKKISSKKYFKIVNIGTDKKPALLISKGESQYTQLKRYGFSGSPYEFMACDVYYFINGKVKKLGTFQHGGRTLSLAKKSGQYYLQNGLSDGAYFGCVRKNKFYVYEYNNGWERSCIKAGGKMIKNLGYLNSRMYVKYRNSYTSTGPIKFMKNTSKNRAKAIK